MSKTKKLFSVLLVIVITITSLICTGVSASAITFDEGSLNICIEDTDDGIVVFLDGYSQTLFDNMMKKSSLKKSDIDAYKIEMTFFDTNMSLDRVYTFEFKLYTDNIKSTRKTTVYQRTSVDRRFLSSVDTEAVYYAANNGTLTTGYYVKIPDKAYAEDIKMHLKPGARFFYTKLTFDMADYSEKDISYTWSNATTYSYGGITSDNWNTVTREDFRLIVVDKMYGSLTSADISDLNITINDKVYTGKQLLPDVTIKTNGKKLVKGRDYTLSYKNNINIGVATVTVKAKGNYTGTAKVTFRIIPPKTTVSAARVDDHIRLDWEAIPAVDKYLIYYSENGGKSYKKAGAVGGNIVGCSLKLAEGKTYTIIIRSYKKVKGKYYYSRYSNPVTV